MLKIPCAEPDELALRVAAQRVVEGEPPLDRVGGVGRPADVEQAAPAVAGDEVGDEGGCAGEVVGGHHVGGLRAEGPGDDDDGEPFGEALYVPGVGEPFADENPVDLARQRIQAGEFRPAGPVCLDEGAEQQPLAVADPFLYAALDLVVVEQALGLDVVLPCLLALQAHHADDVLAAAGQALGGAVGHVAEFLNGLLHADPGGFADPVLAVQDSRDRRGGDDGPAGDIVQSDHGGSFGSGKCQDVSVFGGISAGSR
jgi:hypothetical protein